jgi:hypothetical protein
MKLYTEEDVMLVMELSDLGNSYDSVIAALTPIELPSEEEIEFAADDAYYSSDAICFEIGAKWVIEQIKQQDKWKK